MRGERDAVEGGSRQAAQRGGRGNEAAAAERGRLM
jgi:hypothetical protein